ncbi:hypothetical protein Avbf_01876 [Armadillidium vulgare]|nr:hypothetical protein Avbf_01876 [Armadillidium vulgare]
MERLECKKEGRFEDPSDCGHYFECVPDDFGSLTPYRRSCHGEAFNPRTHTCTDPSKVKGCKVRESRHYSQPSARFNELCADPNVTYACADCGTSIMCSEGKAYATKCEDQFRCVTGESGFGGAVCYPKYDEKCRCREPNTYFQDPYYNGTFFLCKEKDSTPMFYNCPPDMYFDTTSNTCTSEDGLPVCKESGMFAYPNDCKKYYTCTYALEGWVQTRLQCSEGKLFNEQSEVCENPCEWSLSEFRCTEQGRFKNPKDCNQFFECISDTKGDFLKMMRSCPPNHHWNDVSKRCVKSVNSDCKPETEGPITQCQADFNAICNDKDNSSTKSPATESSTESSTRPSTEPSYLLNKLFVN